MEMREVLFYLNVSIPGKHYKQIFEETSHSTKDESPDQVIGHLCANFETKFNIFTWIILNKKITLRTEHNEIYSIFFTYIILMKLLLVGLW